MRCYPAGFSFLFFHGRSRNGKRHLLPLAPCGSIAPAADAGRSCWGSGLQDASAAQGTKQTQGAATRRLPRLESSGDLAALNTRHLLRKPVCGLKAPLGLSCPAGTAVLSGSLLARKREHIRRQCLLQKAQNFRHATTLCAGSIFR